MSNNKKFYINGAWVDPSGSETVDVINPATEEAIGTIALGNHTDVDAAVEAAKAAFESFSQTTVEERLEIIKVYGTKLEEAKAHLAKVMAKETGKPEWETATEVGAMMGKIGISEKAYFERTGNVENPMPVGKKVKKTDG